MKHLYKNPTSLRSRFFETPCSPSADFSASSTTLRSWFSLSCYKGFTLIEVLVVATILGVLAAVAVSSYSSVNKRSRDSKRQSDIQQVRSALEMYRSDNGFYPPVDTSGFGNASDLTGYLVSSYMSAIPSDPTSTQQYYYYATNLSSGNYYGYCLCSKLETQVGSVNTCSVSLPAACNNGVKSP